MSAARRIIEAGFHLETDGERLVVSPASRLTVELRAFIRAHKLEIIRELRHGEAAVLREAFYGHLMGPGLVHGCCHAPAGRYCPDGRRLMNAYCGAARAAGRLN